jgi:DNA-directed RNA polymerase subunit L
MGITRNEHIKETYKIKHDYKPLQSGIIPHIRVTDDSYQRLLLLEARGTTSKHIQQAF